MCIYCGTSRYRKIYESHYGPIPVDPDCKKYDVHHIDGNHKNNNPKNLIALSRQEHYDIHYKQGDMRACQLLAVRLSMPSSEISKLAREASNRLLLAGKHNFQQQINPFAKRHDGTSIASDRALAGFNAGLGHPNANKTFYTFVHKKTGAIEITTVYELRIKYTINKSDIGQVIKGNRKSAGGWKLA